MVDLAPLRRAKLRALLGSVPGGGAVPDGAVESALPGGAALRDPATGAGWALIDDGVVSGFGSALAWAWRHQVAPLGVLVEDRSTGASGIVARRASAWADPPAVWRVEDRSLVAAVPSSPPASSLGALPDSERDAAFTELGALLRAHGVDAVVEHGVLRGEVLGLEVARAVRDRTDGRWRLDVGVGQHDRDARHELRPDQPLADALDEVVAVVRQWRVPGGARHPATMLAREGWLRSVLVGRPDLVGAAELSPVAPPVPVGDLRRAAAAAAVGTSLSGAPLVVVCSTGVDPDLVPTAADARLLHAPGASLVLVVPEGDDYPLTRALAGALRSPAAVHLVPRDWTTLSLM